MKVLIIVLLVLACVGVHGVRLLNTSREHPPPFSLGRDEQIRTLPGNKPSFRYQFDEPLLWVENGVNLRVFGVSTKGPVTVKLHDVNGEFSDFRIDIGRQCIVQFDNIQYVTKDCDIEFTSSWTWFTLQTSNNYLALYASDGKLIADVSASDLWLKNKDINLNTYRKYSVASTKVATWDFQGYFLDKKDLEKVTPVPSLKEPLTKVKRNHRKLQEYIIQCEYVELQRFNHEHPPESRKRFHFMYSKKCVPRWIEPYKQALVKHESILLVNGVTPATVTRQSAVEYFIY